MPPSKQPVGKTTTKVTGLGSIEGLEFPDGFRQFAGVPYADLAKRWTRSTLKTSWPGEHHDGTKLGSSAPNPPEYNALPDPIAPIEHFETPKEDELSCLVLNICAPPQNVEEKVPVLVFIHGGSLVSGGSNLGIYDCVNLCSFASSRGTPLVVIAINYRVGIGGFLTSKAIKEDLEKDGIEGYGNFGLYDQQVALHWINRYVTSFGGNPDEVTIFGESAGGVSVASQIYARDPAPFQRGIAMSGHLNTIFPWTLEQHEKHYRAVLKHLRIDCDAADALNQLRKRPESEVAAATLSVAGAYVATGNPCLDGVFHSDPAPTLENHESPPAWLKGYMCGDVRHESVIFRESFQEENFQGIKDRLTAHLGAESTSTVLELFHISEKDSDEELCAKMEDLATVVIFSAHNWLSLHRSKIPQSFGYHMDQLSKIEGDPLFGFAYHAIDLVYVFLNCEEMLTPAEKELSLAMAADWIEFAYGRDPFQRFEGRNWMTYGPNDVRKLVTEEEDEPVRRYSRMQKLLEMGIYGKLLRAIDDIAVKRYRMGTGWVVPDIARTSV